MEHAQSIYNEFVSDIIFNLPANVEERERDACLRMLPNVAFVDIQMVGHDALVITRNPTWDLVGMASTVGKYPPLFFFFDGKN